MPVCINNSEKKYIGTELSPRGRGYSAENIGEIMVGKDDLLWIVKQTCSYKFWSRININFDKLPKDFYVNAYDPKTEKILCETGLEDKFGGDVPFFIEGESWPIHKDVPMKFFGQFKDPRKNDNILYRLFLPTLTTYELEEYNINSIELNETNIKNQIIISKPSYDIHKKYYDDPSFKPFKIISWNIRKELKPYEIILKLLNLSFGTDTLFDLYYQSKFTPSMSVKIGGTPTYCQHHNFKDYDEDNVLLQITYSQSIPYEWGDLGIAHISKDFTLDWDCH